MTDFYTPTVEDPPDDPFHRDVDGKLVRRSYWLDLSDQSLVMLMNQGLGRKLSYQQKIAHLEDISRAHLAAEMAEIELPARNES